MELLMMSSGIGGPLGGSWSCLGCIASPTCRVLPFMKYLLYFFSQMYILIYLKTIKWAISEKRQAESNLKVWRKLAVVSEWHLGGLCGRQ